MEFVFNSSAPRFMSYPRMRSQDLGGVETLDCGCNLDSEGQENLGLPSTISNATLRGGHALLQEARGGVDNISDSPRMQMGVLKISKLVRSRRRATGSGLQRCLLPKIELCPSLRA